MKHLIINDQQHATIIAALRFYQQSGMGNPANRPAEIDNIATNGDEVLSLDDGGIDELVQLVNFAGDAPRVLITVSGGVADWVSDEGVLVEKFDWDDYRAVHKSRRDEAVSNTFRDMAEPLGVPVAALSDAEEMVA